MPVVMIHVPAALARLGGTADGAYITLRGEGCASRYPCARQAPGTACLPRRKIGPQALAFPVGVGPSAQHAAAALLIPSDRPVRSRTLRRDTFRACDLPPPFRPRLR